MEIVGFVEENYHNRDFKKKLRQEKSDDMDNTKLYTVPFYDANATYSDGLEVQENVYGARCQCLL